jgi:5-methyltetrahydrofolate--homocysteine methyltransferase
MRELKLFVGDKPVLFDGAAGTTLIKRGMPMGVCPEKWASEHPEILKEMHANYVRAGSDAVYAFTFGANPVKLGEYGLDKKTEALNEKLVVIAREAVGPNVPVGGDMTTTGQLLHPMGNLTFSTAREAYRRQAAALARGGADFLIIETMIDIAEMRAAVLGCRDACDLPIYASMTFETGGRTLTGTDATVAAITLCALGVDALGVNCGTGPDDMGPIVAAMRRVSTVPVIAKPNAGLPTGRMLDPNEFAAKTAALVGAGAMGIGGCCGSTDAHIAALGQAIRGMKADIRLQKALPRVLTSRETGVLIGHGLALCAIGERINPTGKPKLQQALINDNMDVVLEMANEQIKAGAAVLDVNVGMANVDQKTMLPKVTQTLGMQTNVPLCIDTTDAQALKAALTVYPGRALINSISAESGRAEAMMPLCAQFGAMAVLLPVNDAGVPKTASERIALVEELLLKAQAYGLPKSAFVVDALAMTLGGQADGGKEALLVLDWCRKNDLLTVMGVSNISFGLPQRPALNAAFLCAAQARGLTAAIVNVCQTEMKQALLAANALIVGGDEVAAYARFYAQPQTAVAGLAGAVLSGERSLAHSLAVQSLSAGKPALSLIDEVMAGLTTLGDAFEAKKTYLPQLMAGAEAAKAALVPIKAALEGGEMETAGTAIIATVKGDMHDIGKNIVSLMLQNNGFRVIDLGKDVDNAVILDAIQAQKGDIVCLSALLTTTMEQMRAFSALNARARKPVPLMIGGAVVTESFASEIGASYAADAVSCARMAKVLVKGYMKD